MRIVADASALLAILLGEPDADVFLAKLLGATKVWISPINWWEVQVRMQRAFGEAGAQKSAAWIESVGVTIEPVGATQARLACEAFARYRSRPAALNLGDTFAYALARTKDAPLLYKGADFTHTDIIAA